uniref:Uncharacterized protein n=1 Tax=Avena sativa TaxID=4498 RepID=A0ACD5WB76_AVESA
MSFRHRFRALHPPPVLGFFITGGRSSIPAFVPLRRRNDPDLAAAVRGGDFFLTRLPDHGQGNGYIDTDDDDASSRWDTQDFRDGYVLLFNPDAQQVAAYNPLTRTLDQFPQPPEDWISGHSYVEFCIFCDEEKPNSFRVFGIYEDDEVHVAVFSSDSRSWEALAWPETPTPDSQLERIDAVGSKFMYWIWRHVPRPYMSVLNTVTLQFSRMDLLPTLRIRGSGKGYRRMSTVTAGETKDGDPCIFEVGECTLSIWLWKSGDDGVGSWVSEEYFSFKEHDHPRDSWGNYLHSGWRPDVVTVAAAIHGFVYLHTNKHPCSFMSICLETGELCKLNLADKRSESQYLHPYIMAWPPSLTDIKKMEEENMGKLAPQGMQMKNLLNH